MAHPQPARELDLAREDVIQALGVHFASDNISVEELDRRLTLAIRARSRGELTQLLADLPVLPDYARGPEAVGRTEVVTTRDVPGRGFVGAFMGGTARKGPWLVPQHIKVFAIMGGFETSAGDVGVTDPAAPVIRLSGLAVMGGVEARHKKPSTRKLRKFEKRLREMRKGKSS